MDKVPINIPSFICLFFDGSGKAVRKDFLNLPLAIVKKYTEKKNSLRLLSNRGVPCLWDEQGTLCVRTCMYISLSTAYRTPIPTCICINVYGNCCTISIKTFIDHLMSSMPDNILVVMDKAASK